MVYHYTTIETLFSILASYKESGDKENLIFWASNVLHQNDSKEMSLKFDDLKTIVDQIEDEKEIGVTYSTRLSYVTEKGIFVPKYPNEVVDEINLVTNDPTETPYTVSFSKNKDDLLMWNIYAKSGAGICLAFDENLINCENDFLFAIKDDVVYGNYIEAYRTVVKDVYMRYLEKIRGLRSFDDLYYKKVIAWRSLLLGISPFVKHAAFKSEKEWRIAFYRDNPDKSKPKVYRRLSPNQNIIDFIKVKIPKIALKHIMIGPCANYEKVFSILKHELLENGIVESEDDDFIQKSNIPFRMF